MNKILKLVDHMGYEWVIRIEHIAQVCKEDDGAVCIYSSRNTKKIILGGEQATTFWNYWNEQFVPKSLLEEQ
ncbi:MAG: hypothetical protein QNJ47_28205 [Nostocaceae cyanobacterium]|nr:hypothetical protein [Nostocaceae cyanobacterium]